MHWAFPTLSLCCVLFLTSCLKQYERIPGPTEYNEEVGHYQVNKAEKKMESLMEKILENQGVADYMVSDPALRAAARNVSHYFKTEGIELIDSVKNTAIKDFLSEMGVTESAYQSLFLHVGNLDQSRKVIQDVFGEDFAAKRFTNYGIGVVRKWLPPSYVVSILLTRKAIELQPFPRTALPNKDYELRGHLALPGNQLTVYIQGKMGTQTLSCRISPGGSFRQEIFFDESGVNIVEMMLDGAAGPEVASLFTVNVEGKGGAGETERLERVEVKTVADASKRLLELINKERKARGLAAVKPDRKATNVAQAYAEEMLLTGQVAHVSATSGDIATRAGDAGLMFQRITENVAVNQSAEDVHEGFIGSPAHRMNIVDREVDKVGLGIAFSSDKRHMYVVEVFVKYQ